MGKIVTHELHSGGRARPVSNDNKYAMNHYCLHDIDIIISYSIPESITSTTWLISECTRKSATKPLPSSVAFGAL